MMKSPGELLFSKCVKNVYVIHTKTIYITSRYFFLICTAFTPVDFPGGPFEGHQPVCGAGEFFFYSDCMDMTLLGPSYPLVLLLTKVAEVGVKITFRAACQ